MENICWQITVAEIKQQPNFSHEAQMQKTIVLRMQKKHEETLMAPLPSDLQRLGCKKHNRSTRNGDWSKSGFFSTKERKNNFESPFKGFLERKHAGHSRAIG